MANKDHEGIGVLVAEKKGSTSETGLGQEADVNMPKFIFSDSEEETEEEIEYSNKKEGDVKKRFLEKIMALLSGSSDDLESEDRSDQIDDLSTNIEGIEQEMRELMRGSREIEEEKGDVKMIQSEDSRNLDLNVNSGIGGTDGKIFNSTREEKKRSENLIEYDEYLDTNIEGLEEVMQESKERSVEDNQHDLSKKLMEWIRPSDNESEEEWECLKKKKLSAIELGIDLSHLLVKIMFYFSNNEELLEKFQSLKSSLTSNITNDGNSMIISKIITLLTMANPEVIEMKDSKKAKCLMEKEIDRIERNEGEIDQLVDQFLEEIILLEYIMKHPGFSDTKMLREEVLSSLDSGNKECEEKLKEIKLKINEWKEKLKEVSSSTFSEVSEMNESWIREMESKINELWGELMYLEEEKDQRSDS